MSYKAEVFNIMLASPGDVSQERNAAREIIFDWNNIHASVRSIVLLPLGWEYNSVPAMGDRPQGIINDQVLKNADILVGIFWTRIGTPTGQAVSGTVEEISEHIKSGKPAMLYFSKKPVVLDSVDLEQYNAVTNLKKDYQSIGLTTDFESLEDFKQKFQRHLSMKLNEPFYQQETAVNSDMHLEIDTDDIRHSLSDSAKKLLKEAANDAAGEIMKIGYMGGFTFQANGQQMNEDYSPRTKAKWEAALNELIEFDLVQSIGYKGEIFQLTEKGYIVADKLN